MDSVVHHMMAMQEASDQVDEAAADCLRLNRTDFRCLGVLCRVGAITAGNLAETSGLTTGAVTTVVDRLERAGYVQRADDPEDRRRVRVELTAPTQERAQALYADLALAGAKDMERYTIEELRVIEDFLRSSTLMQVEHAARLRRTRTGG